jgi:hypothetical protein
MRFPSGDQDGARSSSALLVRRVGLARPVRVDYVNLGGDVIFGIVGDGMAREHYLLPVG